MAEKPKLYLNILSPPCRAVLMVGAELDVDFDWKILDLIGLEHTQLEYIKVVYIPIIVLVLILRNSLKES